MKNSFLILALLLTSVVCSNRVAVAAEVAKKTPAAEYPSTLILTEEQAENLVGPISIPLGATICIELSGDKTLSHVYSSGMGSAWGHKWTFNDEEDEFLNLIDTRIVNLGGQSAGQMITSKMDYRWTFHPEELGETKLTFKKYYYSNAAIRNLDGSSPWKDPIKQIHFTINVVDAVN